MPRARYDAETVNRIREAIKALPAAPPQPLTPQQVIRELRAELKRKHAAGWSWAALAQELSQRGFPISRETLRTHMTRRAARGKRKAKSSATLPSSAGPSVSTQESPPSPPAAAHSQPQLVSPSHRPALADRRLSRSQRRNVFFNEDN